MTDSDDTPVTPDPTEGMTADETRRERLGRHGRRTKLYVMAFLLVALLIVLVALTAANTRAVKLDWLFGTGSASLVWIIVGAAVLGWLLGLVTSTMFRRRTRRST